MHAWHGKLVKPLPVLVAPVGPSDADHEPSKAQRLSSLAAAKLARVGQPFVWRGSGLACRSWDLDYLHEQADPTAPFSVRTSPASFIFTDDRRNTGRFDVASHVAVEDMSFSQFFVRFVESSWEAGFTPFVASELAAGGGGGGGGGPPASFDDDAPAVPLHSLLHYRTLPHGAARAAATAPPAAAAAAAPPDFGPGHTSFNPAPAPDFGASGSPRRMYLQQTLVTGIGERLTEDFRNFDWSTLTLLERAGGWGPLTSNLLLLGHRGSVTPLHYDEQQNLLVCLRGRKVVLLASPDQFACFYPFPIGHPADRQAAVDLRAPDFERFPRLADAVFHYAVLEAGDTLYLPSYWWHEVHHPANDALAVK